MMKVVKITAPPLPHPIPMMTVQEIPTLPITITMMRTTITTTTTLHVFAVFIPIYMVDGAITTPILPISIGTTLFHPIGG